MYNCNWGFMSGFGHGAGMGGFGLIFNVLILVLVGYLAYKLIKHLTATGGKKDRRDSLEILKERYASGDITDEEYQRMRDVLDL